MVWHKNMSNVVILEVDSIAIDLDEQFKSLRPSFLKIDVEGSEGQVILGMQHMISRCQLNIFIECSKAGRHIVWDFLKSLNYKCFQALNIEMEVKDFEMYFSNDFLWIPPNE